MKTKIKEYAIVSAKISVVFACGLMFIALASFIEAFSVKQACYDGIMEACKDGANCIMNSVNSSW